MSAARNKKIHAKAKAKKLLAQMTPEEQQALLEKLRKDTK
jgi:hypothetical protein